MGLIKAFSGALRSELADQWKEYIHCDSLSNDVLLAKGHVNSGRSQFGTSNTRGTSEIISQGSKIAVNEGQALLVVEDGQVVDFTVEPGGYIFDKSSEPSLFCGNFGEGLKKTFEEVGKRFTFGGEAGKIQRAYFVNIKEILGIKFGSQSPVAYDDPYYHTVLYLRYFGTYSFRITDPIRFYSAIAGNVAEAYKSETLLEQCTTEFYTALDTSLNSLATTGAKFSMVPSKQRELANIMSETLNEEWTQRRGISIVAVGINKLTPDDKSRERIEEFDTAMMVGGNQAAMQGTMVNAQAAALKNMGKNEHGTSGMDMAGAAFGMGMMQNMMNGGGPFGGNNNHPTPPAAPKAVPNDDDEIELDDVWVCSCGKKNRGNFCQNCGNKRPDSDKVEEKKDTWICPNCGKECTGKFCMDCGTQRNAEKHYKCDKCGWAPEDDTKPPKFCPECGDPFNEDDIVQ